MQFFLHHYWMGANVNSGISSSDVIAITCANFCFCAFNPHLIINAQATVSRMTKSIVGRLKNKLLVFGSASSLMG